MAKQITVNLAASACPVEPEEKYITSPYDVVQPVKFKDGYQLSIPLQLIWKYKKLYKYFCDVECFPIECAHVCVHYLYTGTYQYLKPKASSLAEKQAAKFEISVQVYVAAREGDVSALQEVAKAEIERLGRDMPVTQVLDLAAKRHYAADDAWFHGFIKSLMEPLMENPSSLDNGQPGQNLSVSSILLKTMLGMWHEKKDAMQSEINRLASEQVKEPVVVEPFETPAACDAEPEPESEVWVSKKKKLPKKEKAKKKKKAELYDEVPPAPEVASASFSWEMEPPEPKKEPAPSDGDWLSWGATKSGSGNSGFSQSNLDTPSSSGPLSVIAESKTASCLGDELEKVPVTISWATPHRDVKVPSFIEIERFSHICAQERFERFSPEELRLKDYASLSKGL